MKIYTLGTLLDDKEEPIWASPTGFEATANLGKLQRKARLAGGKSLKEDWHPQVIWVTRWSDDPPRPLADLAFMGSGLLLVSQKAADSLGDLLDRHGELLPLHLDRSKTYVQVMDGKNPWGQRQAVELDTPLVGGPYYFYNVMTVIDPINHDTSYLKWSKLSGIEFLTEAYILDFKESALEDIEIFQLPFKGAADTSIFVGEAFKRRVEQADLRSLDFKLVWDSENPDYHDERYTPEQWERIKKQYGRS